MNSLEMTLDEVDLNLLVKGNGDGLRFQIFLESGFTTTN